MNSIEKEISYQTTNTYSTLNTLTNETKNIWFVCHGMGYLSRYFLKYFKELNPEENYIVAPQAASKYYITSKFKHIGASWLTKENTLVETENIMQYYDAIFESEELNTDTKNIIVLGYSQGVSVSMRYVAKRKLQCSQLVMCSGGIPKELNASDFKFLNTTNTKISLVYGDKDEYLTKDRIIDETARAKELFGDNLNIIPFEGVHEVKTEIINSLV
ncbi:esterase [Flavobacteriaceae bacterium AU392]|nr:esterase [Flavobacteriaceae bacterium]RKM85423.1 esterase [Flavobacteriaceae bacterium AU392]